MVAIIAFIVFVESARRKIPVSYASATLGARSSRSANDNAFEDQLGGVIPCLRLFGVVDASEVFAAFPPDPKQSDHRWAKIYNCFQVSPE